MSAVCVLCMYVPMCAMHVFMCVWYGMVENAQKLKFLSDSPQRASGLSCIDSDLQTVPCGKDPETEDHVEAVP